MITGVLTTVSRGTLPDLVTSGGYALVAIAVVELAQAGYRRTAEPAVA